MEYINIFQAARKSKGYTQEKLAELTGVSVGTIKAYESDKTIPKDPEIVRRLVNILDAQHLYAELANKNPLNQEVIPKISTNQPLLKVAMRTVKDLKEIEPEVDQFFFITSKGEIDAGEQKDYDNFVKKLENILSCCLDLKFAKK